MKGRHSEGPLWYRVGVRVRVRVSDWWTLVLLLSHIQTQTLTPTLAITVLQLIKQQAVGHFSGRSNLLYTVITGGLRETHPTVPTAPPTSSLNPNSNLNTNPNPETKLTLTLTLLKNW